MMPYALALHRSGHAVAFATGSRMAPVVKAAGLDHFPCGVDDASQEHHLTDLPEWPELCAQLAGAHPSVLQIHGFIQGLAPRMWPGLQAAMEAWRPQVILRDPLEFAGLFAAEKAGIPHATVDWAIHIPTGQLAGAALTALGAQFGLADPARAAQALDRSMVLSAMPPSWSYPGLPDPAVLGRYAVPPFDHSGHPDLPAWFSARPARPLVYATLGTTFNQSPETLRTFLGALAAEPLDALITVGHDQDPEAFGPVPESIHIERYVPQSLALPHCDAMLFHGGFNSMQAALWHGLPMVLVPMAAGDQLPNAMQAVAQGAGVMVEGPLTVPSLRQALHRVLADGPVRARARELGAAMRALPPLAEAVRQLEALAELRVQRGERSAGSGHHACCPSARFQPGPGL
jgi:UDP:flavonoid glycosyltransferase YjiC (YdhE family)